VIRSPEARIIPCIVPEVAQEVSSGHTRQMQAIRFILFFPCMVSD
jgi:hypothetical protein